MAAARCLRWGLSRARAWLPPPPPRCPRRELHKQADGAGFQSSYSLDKLYPESRGSDTAWRVPDDAKQANDIPLDRLTISYCRSSGPGGQNVNKVNSKAEIRFHLATADWIAEPVRQKMAVMYKNKINRRGELILTSECSRYQLRNLADCLQKIRDMIAEASQTPKEPSKEDAVLRRIRKHEPGKAEKKEDQFCHKGRQEGRYGLKSPSGAGRALRCGRAAGRSSVLQATALLFPVLVRLRHWSHRDCPLRGRVAEVSRR
ncbi:peptidyl-tRNA hydrolase ICT1, mitochondrial isoform X3 [Pipistrellus kuhlii]|uniref:peptidyl-tRNA hydrolase ICT1, mitochondrial isoform X3 n=1 Tax=Pipistrellus kuhlii TaxID=59472 RepID=UPI001E271F16|nr:peptidyl-tRNA hydrolase ICT1, mitochondrial isoform X3 [Pipistrellus kuhlii]